MEEKSSADEDGSSHLGGSRTPDPDDDKVTSNAELGYSEDTVSLSSISNATIQESAEKRPENGDNVMVVEEVEEVHVEETQNYGEENEGIALSREEVEKSKEDRIEDADKNIENSIEDVDKSKEDSIEDVDKNIEDRTVENTDKNVEDRIEEDTDNRPVDRTEEEAEINVEEDIENRDVRKEHATDNNEDDMIEGDTYEKGGEVSENDTEKEEEEDENSDRGKTVRRRRWRKKIYCNKRSKHSRHCKDKPLNAYAEDQLAENCVRNTQDVSSKSRITSSLRRTNEFPKGATIKQILQARDGKSPCTSDIDWYDESKTLLVSLIDIGPALQGKTSFCVTRKPKMGRRPRYQHIIDMLTAPPEENQVNKRHIRSRSNSNDSNRQTNMIRNPKLIQYNDKNRIVYTYVDPKEKDKVANANHPGRTLNVSQVPGGRYVYRLDKNEKVGKVVNKLNYHGELNEMCDNSAVLKSRLRATVLEREKVKMVLEEEMERENREDYEKSLEEIVQASKVGSSAMNAGPFYDVVVDKNYDEQGVGNRLTDCDICFMRSVPFKHKLEHTKKNALISCNLCQVTFCSQFIRNIHSTIHIKPAPARMYLRCSVCSKEFKGADCERMLRLHVGSCHISELHKSKIVCIICNLRFVEMSMLRIHMDSHKPLPSQCTCLQETCSSCLIAGRSVYKDPQPTKVIHAADSKEEERKGVPILSTKLRSCDFCKFRFTDLPRHSLTHRITANDKCFTCRVCTVKFKSRNMARLHTKMHVQKMPTTPTYMTCSICYKQTRNIAAHVGQLHNHVAKDIKCPYCKVFVNEESLLVLHIQTHWPLIPCLCRRKACKVCNPPDSSDETQAPKTLASVQAGADSLPPVVHFSSFHAEKAECYVCHLFFANLEEHLREEHVPQSKFRCSTCKAGFVKKSMAMFHMYVHAGVQLTVKNTCGVCKQCPEEDMYQHVVDKHLLLPPEEQFVCELCHIQVPEENLFRMHLIRHIPKCLEASSEIDYICSANVAVSKFERKGGIGHEMSGMMIAEFKACDVCHLRVENVKEHAIEHQSNKARFRCRVCKVTFHTETLSSTHALIHCNKTPHYNLSCTLCQRMPPFPTKNTLISHALMNHTEELGKRSAPVCGICSAVFPEENSLQVHKQQHLAKECRCLSKDCKYCSYHSCAHCGQFFNLHMKKHFVQHVEECTRSSENKSSSSQVIKIAHVTPYQRSDTASPRHPQQPRRSVSAARLESPMLVDSDDEEEEEEIAASTTSTSRALIAKKSSQDTGQASTECVSCGIKIRSGTIAEHLRRCHNKRLSLFDCNKCSFKAPDADVLLRHHTTHMPHDNFLCLFCREHFLTFIGLVSHNYEVHFQRYHRCNLCLMYFSELDLLRKHNHVNNWRSPQGIPCTHCCRSFRNFDELRKHRWNHGTECTCNDPDCIECNKFQCSCGVTFKAHQFIQYMLHMRSCYCCFSCDKKFDNATDRAVHEKVHFAKCKVCGILRRNARQMQEHMAQHNCMCEADNRDCLFCKKAWCSVCGHRFIRPELADYKSHRAICIDSDLLCICREQDCVICQNAKCPFCSRTFLKYRFFSFSVHVKACMGDSPDPFAPAPAKKIKIKEEPIDLDYTRKRKVVDKTVIAVDSDSDFEKECAEEAKKSQVESQSETLDKNVFDIFQEHSAADDAVPSTSSAVGNRRSSQTSNNSDTSRLLRQHTAEEGVANSSSDEVVCIGSEWSQPVDTPQSTTTTISLSSVNIANNNNTEQENVLRISPDAGAGEDSAMTRVYSIPTHLIEDSCYSVAGSPRTAPLPVSVSEHRQSPIMQQSAPGDVICIAPEESPEEEEIRQPQIINICPEEPMEEEFCGSGGGGGGDRGGSTMDSSMSMNEFVVEPIAKLDPQKMMLLYGGQGGKGDGDENASAE